MSLPVAFYTISSTEGASGAAVTLTVPAPSVGRILVYRVYASYSTASSSGLLTISEGANVVSRYYIHGSDGLLLEKAFAPETSVTVTLAAATGASGTIAIHWTVV